jgi:hypothetical protein
MRKRRANMSPSEREAYLVKVRETSRQRFKDPKKRAAQTASKHRTAQRKISQGICVACLELITCGDRYCFKHWLLSVGHKYGLTIKNGGVKLIEAIWNEQAGTCALTGEKLVPGYNASLDHILPRCRGGTNEKSNLQWVTKQVNWFKRSRTNGELIPVCLKIAHHMDRHDRSNVVPLVKKAE